MPCSDPSHEVISDDKIQKLCESLDALLSGHYALQNFFYLETANAIGNKYILSTALKNHP